MKRHGKGMVLVTIALSVFNFYRSRCYRF